MALAAWLLPLAGATATELHLLFDDHHLPAVADAADPASLRGPVHTHDVPGQAPAVSSDAAPRLRPAPASSVAIGPTAAFDTPRLDERFGVAGRAGRSPDPPHLAASHSILRI